MLICFIQSMTVSILLNNICPQLIPYSTTHDPLVPRSAMCPSGFARERSLFFFRVKRQREAIPPSPPACWPRHFSLPNLHSAPPPFTMSSLNPHPHQPPLWRQS